MQEVLQPLLAKCYLFYSMPKHAIECDTCRTPHSLSISNDQNKSTNISYSLGHEQDMDFRSKLTTALLKVYRFWNSPI